MPARHRERGVMSGKGGSYYNYLSVPSTTLRTGEDGIYQICNDVVGNRRGVNPFDLSTTHVWRPVLDGRVTGGDGSLLREFIAYPIDYTPVPDDPRDSFPQLDEVDRSNVGWELLGKTNVSLPHVDLPSFIGELPETYWGVKHLVGPGAIPALIWEYGHNLLTAVAAGHLAWRWAVKPMISDVRKMLSFMDSVRKRELELQLLGDGQPIRRRAGLGNESNVVSDTEVFLHSGGGAIIKARRKVTHTSTMWGSVTFKAIGDGNIPTDYVKRRDFVHRLMLGMNDRGLLAAAWELCPWSWFIDWFAGLGTVLQATNNTVNVTWSDNCVMRKTRSESEFTLLPGSWQDWCTISGVPIEIHERKERYLCAPVLPFIPSLQPLVSPKAWSILASLWTLRNLRSPRGRSRRETRP